MPPPPPPPPPPPANTRSAAIAPPPPPTAAASPPPKLNQPKPSSPASPTSPVPARNPAKLHTASSSTTGSDSPVSPRPPVLDRPPSPFPSSSSLSSPRRPRRAGTGLPMRPTISSHQFESAEGLNQISARDEFEEQFLSRHFADSESQIISDVLEDVHFKQLDDDEEFLSDDDQHHSSRKQQLLSHHNDYYPYTRPIQWRAERQSTVTSNWRRIPTEVGIDGCQGCERLCGENRRLRRQLDELEFEMASGVLRNPPDGFDSPIRAMPVIPQIPVSAKKKKSWASKLKNSTMISTSNSKPSSERARLRSEVSALTVTTEYLWRKLNMAEMELRAYRRKDLRIRMKMTETTRKASVQHDTALLVSANGDSQAR